MLYQDATSHWHQCTDSTCPDPRASATELASHTFVWKVDQAATTTQTGLKHEECTVCSYKRSENTVIPKDSGFPPTGDNSNLMPWIALLFVSGGVCTVLTVKRKKSVSTRM